ncbi:MAG: SURF1 family protein [Pontimonas sp.]
MWRVARRPKWIAALFLALGVASIFGLLGQWQLDRSIEQGTIIERNTETVVPLESVATPQSVITSEASGRMVSVECRFVEGDDVVLDNRRTLQGVGQWLVRHCMTEQGNSLAVALGFAPSGVVPNTLPATTGEIVGRYVPTESPQQSDFVAGEISTVAIPELLNLWADPGPVYGGYLVLSEAPEGLTTIGTEAPPTESQLNWLNLFYALQWVIFGLFALYLWWRLVRDEWEREAENASSPAP